MRKITFALLMPVLLTLTACTTWAPKGHGGMAEHHQKMFNTIMPDKSLGIEHGLRFELDLIRRHLDILVIEGAELCFPASVTQARHRTNRITRELYSGLTFDAANDLVIQRKLLERLEQQLDYVQHQDICDSPERKEQNIPIDMANKIYHLLNIDNQFEANSSQINPKYVVHLAEVAMLLHDQPGYHLLITGHAGEVGISDYNHKLSMNRAKQVGRYLQILGLPDEKIKIDVIGSNPPLAEGKEPHNRLANRRVSIEIIEVTGLEQTTKEMK